MITIPLRPLIEQLETIRKEMLAEEWTFSDRLNQLQPHYRDSARNLLHYLTLRKFDLRTIQEQLSSLGISSIGHSERYTLVNLTNILHLLQLLDGKSDSEIRASGIRFSLSYPKSKKKLQSNTEKLFGPERHAGHTRIMVTLPSEAATDYSIISGLLKEEVEILRINCSHDDEEAWLRMIGFIEKAKKETGNSCMLYMDLAGPKLRTGPVEERAEARKKEKRQGMGNYILLNKGDVLEVYREELTGNEGRYGGTPQISTTLPQVFDFVKTGEPIWFDDGVIGGTIVEANPYKWVVKINYCGIDGSKLRADKGINLPDTDIRLPSLTDFDLKTLPFIARHAHLVGYSFVRTPSDLRTLQNHLAELGQKEIGIILKIETKESFDNLPFLLMQAMKSEKAGVMIARGDLAVEVGWARIAEVQEQIAWLCEAAHMPYIWATQILETLAKKGVATRAEITDAAMAARAECAMLNKGPYILEAVKTLKNIDQRMVAHHQKKMESLRPLHVAQRFFRHPELEW